MRLAEEPRHRADSDSTLLLDIVSDAICPWCYVAKRRIEQAAAQFVDDGFFIDLHWRPYELNPEMPIGGMNRKEYRSAKFGSWARSQELDAEVANQAKVEGIVFNYEAMARTPNTRAAHQLIALSHKEGGSALQDKIVECIFAAYFTEGKDIGDIDVLSAIAQSAGFDAVDLPAKLRANEALPGVLADEKRAVSAGVRSVPSVLAARYLVFSGAQRSDDIVKAFKLAYGRIENDVNTKRLFE